MMEGAPAPPDPKKWKKKSKKSFLQKAKKFGKRGQFGRGKQVEKETYDYFVRVLEQMKTPFEDDEAKGVEIIWRAINPQGFLLICFFFSDFLLGIFIHNVFQETEGEELNLCGNQLVSRVIEDLLPQSVYQIRERFMTCFSEDLRIACTDAFQSHVLEKLMKMAAKKDHVSLSFFASVRFERLRDLWTSCNKKNFFAERRRGFSFV